MSVRALIKDFILLFATKGRRKLRDLEKIQDKTFKIQETLNESKAKMNEAYITAKTELGIAQSGATDLQNSITKTENTLLLLADATSEEDLSDQNILNAEIQALEVEYEEAMVQVNHLEKLTESIAARRKSLDADINEANYILRASNARYRTAETLLKANAGVLDTKVFDEIEEIKKQSVALQKRNVAIAEVADEDRKKSVKDVVARHNGSRLTPMQRIQQLKDRSNTPSE